MSEPDDADQSETHPEIAAMLREEPVAVDPARREAAIDAALELGAVLWPAEEPVAEDPVDELAARRHVAPVPAPRRASSGGPRRVALVAAAVAVIAGLGIAGVAAIQGEGDFLAVSSSGNDSADSGGSAAESAPADMDASGSAAAGEAESSAQAEDRAEVPDELLTTTAPPSLGAAADLGSFESVEALLDALVATGYRSAAPGTSKDDAAASLWQGCAELDASGLTVTGRAAVASQPVLVAVAGPDASILVVVDATTCVELGRR